MLVLEVRDVTLRTVAVPTASLLCLYDLEGDQLYTVKWYKGRQEFFRYVLKELPHTRVFALPGINIDDSSVYFIVLGSAARDPHGIKQITVGPPHGIKQITMFIRENVECLDSSFTTTTTIKIDRQALTSQSRYHHWGSTAKHVICPCVVPLGFGVLVMLDIRANIYSPLLKMSTLHQLEHIFALIAICYKIVLLSQDIPK
ncbi:hypothetical protein J6590_092867 [Homalodisca vitripennis]|nr:hypothetical protein J6590_092867 [Homalodisca vitripennis]